MIGAVSHLHEALIMLDDMMQLKMSFCHMSADVRKHARRLVLVRMSFLVLVCSFWFCIMEISSSKHRWPFPPLVDSQLPQIEQPLGSTV